VANRQRGLLVLHASGVAFPDCAAIFLGETGAGKSTLAAAFYSRGRSIVADDLIAVRNCGPIPQVLPGFPRLRLSPAEAASLIPKAIGINPPEDLEADGKQSYWADRNFPDQPLPLRAIYFLRPGKTLEIHSLAPREAVLNLVRHSSLISLFHNLLGQENFLQCAKLVETTRINWVSVPQSLVALNDVTETIEKNLVPVG
jgi:hypothetical protein